MTINQPMLISMLVSSILSATVATSATTAPATTRTSESEGVRVQLELIEQELTLYEAVATQLEWNENDRKWLHDIVEAERARVGQSTRDMNKLAAEYRLTPEQLAVELRMGMESRVQQEISKRPALAQAWGMQRARCDLVNGATLYSPRSLIKWVRAAQLGDTSQRELEQVIQTAHKEMLERFPAAQARDASADAALQFQRLMNDGAVWARVLKLDAPLRKKFYDVVEARAREGIAERAVLIRMLMLRAEQLPPDDALVSITDLDPEKTAASADADYALIAVGEKTPKQVVHMKKDNQFGFAINPALTKFVAFAGDDFIQLESDKLYYWARR